MNSIDDFSSTTAGTRSVRANRLSAEAPHHCTSDDWVVREEVLTIEVESIGSYALMWTPTATNIGDVGYTSTDGILPPGDIPEALALAAGFALTEGIINELPDIAAMWICAERTDVVNIRLTQPDAGAVRRRNVVVNSSCGVCGAHDQALAGLAGQQAPTDRLRIHAADFDLIQAAMAHRQQIYPLTGGTHGAVLFDRDISVVASAEDIGRHNALDKVIGHRFLSGQDFGGCGVFLSSRASYEMVAKAVRVGLEVLATISAPTSLAIELAGLHGLTLCGFVRGNRATAYTHPHRIRPFSAPDATALTTNIAQQQCAEKFARLGG